MSKTELIILPSKPKFPLSPSDTSIYPITLVRNLASHLLLRIQSFNKFCSFYFLYVSQIHLSISSPLLKILQWLPISLRIKPELLKKPDDTLHNLVSAFLFSFKDPTLSLETETLQDFFPLLRMLSLLLLLWLTATHPLSLREDLPHQSISGTPIILLHSTPYFPFIAFIKTHNHICFCIYLLFLSAH